MGCGSSTTSNNTQTKKTNDKQVTRINTKSLIGRNKKDFEEFYKITELIGKGKNSKVLKVLHLPTKQYRACKQIYKSNLRFNDGEEIFQREIEFLADLDHPNIVKLFEYFVEESCYYLILELATGKELMQHVEEINNFSERQAGIIMEQIFSCVTYLHSKNISHQNIKPENILLESKNIGNFNVKLIDFENAQCFNLQNDQVDSTTGTIFYMAPEVFKGKSVLKSDVWSCGIIMYLLLCGYPPFFADDDKDLIEMIKKGKLNFYEEDWGKISKEAKDLLSKLLCVDPNKRLSGEETLQDPWIKKITMLREKENDQDETLKINHKIHKFSSKQKLQQAAIAFIVHQTSSNDLAKKLREIFKIMDKSGDGRLTYVELKCGYAKYFKHTNLSEKEFEDLIKTFDRDGSEYVEFSEFLAAFIDKESLMTENNLELAFNYFDDDKSGKLSMVEIKRILGVAKGDKEGHFIVEQIIKENDTNDDGEISIDEFKKLMKKILKQ